ncbi:MAG: hypothetical protein JO025_08280 [Verrucomicrobia bacterium]|nr:hypothetical protein [Verrucomicrobiota bacterium]
MQTGWVASKRALFAIIENARSSGTAVRLISDDVDELTICDRVLVAFKGRLIGDSAGIGTVVAAIEGVEAGESQGRRWRPGHMIFSQI